MFPDLVSFSGYATSGKDTAADTLVDHKGYVKTYMSKPLEQALLTLNPWIKFAGATERYSLFHSMVGYDESKKNPEVRRLLQTLGTEVGRKMFSEDVWTDLVFREIGGLHHAGKKVCLTGIRFENEIQRVRQAGGVTVWIDRPGVDAVNAHSSEHTLSPSNCDFIVINDGTITDLYEKLNFLFSQNDKPRMRIINYPECRFGDSETLIGSGPGGLPSSYRFDCQTHNFAMFMPIDKAPQHCTMYETETE